MDAPRERFTLKAIGRVESPVKEPRDDRWRNVTSTIRLFGDVVGEEATKGLEDFSHVDVVFIMHLVAPEAVERNARHPRNDPGWPEVGILAQRAKRRVNRIGVTTCELVAVDGLAVTVHSLDAVDGTPVLDLKPHLPAMGPRSAVRAPAWAEAIMEEYFSEA